MRVQLQRQRGGRTVHHGSAVLKAGAEHGMTDERLAKALTSLRALEVIPSSEQAKADVPLRRALRWVATRPPAGISGRFSKSFYLAPHLPSEPWRFDVEGISGTPLRR